MTLTRRTALAAFFSPFSFSQVVAQPSELLTPFRRSDGKWGYVNADHCWVIEPRFDSAFQFKEGLAGVRIGNRWGFIDQAGRTAISLQHQSVGSFSEGLASVRIDGRWGFVDRVGREVIRVQFDLGDAVGSDGTVFDWSSLPDAAGRVRVLPPISPGL
jgi:hypothetical protein